MWKVRAHHQAEVKLRELRASMNGLKEHLQILQQENQEKKNALSTLRSHIVEMSNVKEFQDIYVIQLKARIDKLELEKESSLAVS